MIVLGIDPGLSGGLAIVQGSAQLPPRLLGVIDVPTTGEHAKRRVDVAAVLAFLRTQEIDHAIIERAQAMPDQGSSSGFVYGRAVGALEACVDGMMIASTIIESTAWKKTHGLMKTQKEDSRQRAIKLFPGAPGFERKKDHNRAEAALIAWHGFVVVLKGTRSDQRTPIDPPAPAGVPARA